MGHSSRFPQGKKGGPRGAGAARARTCGDLRGAADRELCDGLVGRSEQNTPVSLSRIAWLVTVFGFVVAALLLLLEGYVGYFGVLLAVAAAAAVNLR